MQGNGCFVIVSQGHIQTLDGSWTGAFHKTPITVGYIACNMNGVLTKGLNLGSKVGSTRVSNLPYKVGDVCTTLMDTLTVHTLG